MTEPNRSEKARAPTALHLIKDWAARDAARPALVMPRAWQDGGVTDRVSVSFGELWQRTSDLARGLDARGFEELDRVLVAAPLSVDVYAFLLAVLSRGLTAVFIDPTTRAKRTVRGALSIARPRGVVSTPNALRYRWLIPSLWGAKAFVTEGTSWGARTLDQLAIPGDPIEPREMSPDAEAMITFTSGSTGRPKGVVRTYCVALGQHYGLAALHGVSAGDVHLTSMPVVAFHNLMSGATTVLPARDPMRREGTDARAVVAQLEAEKVTYVSGAPAFVEEIADELLRQGKTIPTLKAVLTGAAPVGRKLALKLAQAFAGADVRVTYGSTEAEPMSVATATEIVSHAGRGYFVGRVGTVGEVRVARLDEGPVTVQGEGVKAHFVGTRVEGEIIVRGPQVVERYLNDPAAEARLKIRDVDGTLWHRTLDLGFFDEHENLWLTGRVPDRIPSAPEPIAPLPVEAALDETLGVRRSALIAHAQAPHGEALIELDPNPPEGVEDMCRRVLSEHGLSDLPLSFVPEIAVDPRHFSKLDRPAMRAARGGA